MTKGADTRARILDRAFRLAGRDGLAGVTLGTLASELSMSKSGLFAHFKSKEELQLEVLRTAAERFAASVLRPAFDSPRGLPRLRKLFQNWLSWANDPSMPGGCIFFAAALELDDKPGPPRDFLVAAQKDLLATVAKAVRMCIEAGHFRPGLDADQFAFELVGILYAYTHARRLLHDKKAEERTRVAFERLVESARV